MKRLVTLFLAAFVCVSLVWLVAGEFRHGAGGETGSVNAPERKIIVYCFHSNYRCETCGKFEAYNDEVIRTAFAARAEIRPAGMEECKR